MTGRVLVNSPGSLISRDYGFAPGAVVVSRARIAHHESDAPSDEDAVATILSLDAVPPPDPDGCRVKHDAARERRGPRVSALCKKGECR